MKRNTKNISLSTRGEEERSEREKMGEKKLMGNEENAKIPCFA